MAADDKTSDDSTGRLRLTIKRAGDVAGVAAKQAAVVSKVVASHGARAGASAADGVKRRLPAREAAEPARVAILDETAPDAAVVETSPAGATLAAQFLLADYLASRHPDEGRREKMEGVVTRHGAALSEIGIADDEALATVAVYLRSLPTDEQIGFFVDLYFLDPFAPYALKTENVERREALSRLAEIVGEDDGIVDRINATRKAALSAHARKSLGRIGYVGLSAAVLLGVAGLLAAPLVGAALGAGAGLAGAAATSHGLAILGGGALAAGGAGMAGGMWVVAGAGAAAGLMAGGGGVALYELGSSTARGELVKLQITFKLGLLDANRDMAKAQQAIANLVAQADDLKALLVTERRLNDENARRVKDLEKTLEDIEETIVWMEREADIAGG